MILSYGVEAYATTLADEGVVWLESEAEVKEAETEETETEETETEETESDESEVEIPELGIADFALAIGESRQLEAPTMEFQGEILTATVAWSVSQEYNGVISVTDDGIVEAYEMGNAYVDATYAFYKDSELIGEGNGRVCVYVTDPSILQTEYIINIYGITPTKKKKTYNTDTYIELNGVYAFSSIEVITDSEDLVMKTIDNKIYFRPKKTGKFKVTVIVDGRKFQCTAKVYNIYFKRNKYTIADKSSKNWIEGRSTVALEKGKSTTLKAYGMPKNQDIIWESSNPNVVSVNKSGKITAKKYGEAVISVSCPDVTITYHVAVTYTTAIKAVRYCYKHWQATYSQPKRMQKDYYDCSSFVWRAYMDAGFNIGNAKWYAPTAAAEAYWCVQNNYMLYSGTVNVDDLMPGDLIFWTGAKNGRYKGIYHVDIYIGNRTRLTVPNERYLGETISNCMVARISGVRPATLKINKTTVDSKKGCKLSWGNVYGATGYQIMRSSSPKGKFVAIKKVKNGKSFIDTTGKKGKRYYYKVRPFYQNNKKIYYGRYSPVSSMRF